MKKGIINNDNRTPGGFIPPHISREPISYGKYEKLIAENAALKKEVEYLWSVRIKDLEAENAALKAANDDVNDVRIELENELKTARGALRTLAIEIRKRTSRDPEDNPDEIEQYWVDYVLAHPTEDK